MCSGALVGRCFQRAILFGDIVKFYKRQVVVCKQLLTIFINRQHPVTIWNRELIMSTLRDDELSEKYFYAGCFGLPWLWIVHTLNYSAKQRNNEGLLNSDGTFFSFLLYRFWSDHSEMNPCSDLLIHPTLFFSPDGSQDDEAMEIAQKEAQWVARCRNSAIIVTLAWIVWVVVVQVLFTKIFPVGLYIRSPDEGEYTGW